MKKTFAIILTSLCIALAENAISQVNIGSMDDPQEFSVLELSTGGDRGFRLPHMTATERNALDLTGKDAARGLQIFNTTTRCVDTWNGSKWIETCGAPVVYLNTDICTGSAVPAVGFMKYNLGADPQYDTPKKQMGYLATITYPKNNGASNAHVDATVLGGLYQWGRKDITHGSSGSPAYTRYNNSDNTSSTQIVNQESTMFITGHTNWYTGNNATSLWGNGEGLTGQSDNKGGVLYNGGYYQNTDWATPENNPCPSGFRVPTQDEWERICDYDCNPSTTANNFDISGTAGTANNSGLTWVPVVCNGSGASGKCVPSTATSDAENSASGFAIYDTGVWDAAKNTGGVYAGFTGNNFPSGASLHDTSAPEPLLFLPAAGYRAYTTNASTINQSNQRGFYWSSTHDNSKTYAYCWVFSHNAAYNYDQENNA
ncbi:MAG: fibrobacter succinogenes major paralogous domain-containing protein, partial [Dysgonamonadaceae bacterium]|nr:fibrobacter succinogenes major paralogous domain-containing protein [Dysgonamonadaceae bacterium]